MKKLMALALVIVLALSLAACKVNVNDGGSGNPTNTPSGSSTPGGNNNPSSTPSGGNNNPGGDNTTPSGGNGGNEDKTPVDLDGWLVNKPFALKAPEGWEIKNNEGDSSFSSSDAGSTIELSWAGWASATASDSIDTVFGFVQISNTENVKVGGYDGKKGSTSFAGITITMYVLDVGDRRLAIINFEAANADETKAFETALATFKEIK